MKEEHYFNDKKKSNLAKLVFVFLGLLSISSFISPPFALFIGIVFAQFFSHPYPDMNQKMNRILLQASIVGLGFGINLTTALNTGKDGFVFTLATIIGTLSLGLLLGKFLQTDKITSFLISGGTAICGGSAVAALTPIVKANEKQTSVALGTIFILNAIALFLFPVIANFLHLTQNQFGLWCAIAIHDTSSVVGAATRYGDQALQVATTVKLARALWIIPLALGSSIFINQRITKIKFPYFIGLFIIAIVLYTFLPAVAEISPYIVKGSKTTLTLTLFLIGSSMSAKLLKSVGMKPILQGLILWIVVSLITLIIIMELTKT